jgi:hypothetical protein
MVFKAGFLRQKDPYLKTMQAANLRSRPDSRYNWLQVATSTTAKQSGFPTIFPLTFLGKN